MPALPLRWFRFPLSSAFQFLTVLLILSLSTTVSGQLLDSGATSKDVLVSFNAAPTATDLGRIATLGGTVTRQYRNFPIVAVTIAATQVDALQLLPGVKYVADDLELKLFAQGPPPKRGKQILDYGVRIIEAPAAWAAGHRGQNVKVGIFDSGIDLSHPDLEVAGGIDLIGYDGHGMSDCNGHGTHVAGIVAARDNGHGTVGVAPRAQLYAMKFFDCDGAGATVSRELAGIDWAIDNGMQVINMSFGCCYVAGAAFVPIPNPAEEEAMRAAYDAGIVLVAAMGNDTAPSGGFPAGYDTVIGVSATNDRDNFASFSNFGADTELAAPGEVVYASYLVGEGQRSALTVDSDQGNELLAVGMQFAGMTGKSGLTREVEFFGLGTPADFAGRHCGGKTALIARGGTTFAEKTYEAMLAGCSSVIIHNNQPGNFNGTLGEPAAPDGSAWIPVVSISLDDGLYMHEQLQERATTATMLIVPGDQALLTGTSMASPHATGVAALIRGKDPSLSNDQVRQILRDSADDLGTPGWDPLFGYGRVNAKRAVE
jgi:serine protease